MVERGYRTYFCDVSMLNGSMLGVSMLIYDLLIMGIKLASLPDILFLPVPMIFLYIV